MDSVHVSSQLGRLDVVSALLAIVSLLIAIGGVFFFINVKNSARKKAKKVARIEMEQAKKEVDRLKAEQRDVYYMASHFNVSKEAIRALHLQPFFQTGCFR